MKTFLLFTAILLTLATPLRAQHSHLNAGVSDTNHNGIPDPGEPLSFVNGADFSAASNYFLAVSWKTAGAYTGTFSGNLTFTALAASPELGGPEFGHAALGSHIVVQLVAVNGPVGGAFSFWDVGATTPTASLAVGAASSPALRWNLSENDGLPGDDPYGHVHGRQFSVNQSGTYTVTFQLFDTSANGSGGSPIHLPSDTFQMTVLAVPEPAVSLLVAIGGIVAMVMNLRRRRRG